MINTKKPKTLSSLSKQEAGAYVRKIFAIKHKLLILYCYYLNNNTDMDMLERNQTEINETICELFGHDSIEYETYCVDFVSASMISYISGNDIVTHAIRKSINASIARMSTLISLLEEQAGAEESNAAGSTIRIYEGLKLHPEIAGATSALFKSSHYYNAVESAVEALNKLVYMHAAEKDISCLTQRAFHSATPSLEPDVLAARSDTDDQIGVMMLYSGAITALRNPRVHDFLEYDPEGALEFVAFASLLAKLLDKPDR